jgi:hypothetical protein
VEPTGIEPATSWMQTSVSPIVSEDSKQLTPPPSVACTNACTNEAKTVNVDALIEGDTLAQLALDLAKLSPSDRQRLAAMLTGHTADQTEANR